MGNYQSSCEEIDNTSSKSEAKYLAYEYQMAFGSKWKIWIEVQTFDQKYGTLDECYPLEN